MRDPEGVGREGRREGRGEGGRERKKRRTRTGLEEEHEKR